MKQKEIEEYAKNNYVPIARVDVIDFLVKQIILNQYCQILEIGTAIGYTTIQLALVSQNIKITTVEYDEERIRIAKSNFEDCGVTEQIRLIKEDARYFYPDKCYDLIFLDASKKCNILFFDRLINYLNEGGIIIIDNTNLNDHLGPIDEKKKSIFKEINGNLRKYLSNREDVETLFYDEIGDGIAVSKKREK